MNDKVVLELKDVCKNYFSGGTELKILSNLNLSLCAGQRCVIVGKSGCGKSTLLNMIGGLDTVTSGSVIINNTDMKDMNTKQMNDFRKKSLGLIFQFHYLLKDFTAAENIFLPAYMAGMKRKDAMEKANALIDEVGLFERKDHLPSQLSGGERQRVAVARALINSPSLILADEPTGNLDPENAVLISNLLFEMADKYEKTLILVTHDEKIAEKGSEIYKIIQGNLVRK